MKKSPPSKRNLPVAPPRHEFEHVEPTVIHHPEEDMTALARATRHVLDAPGKRLMPIVAVVVGVLAAVFLWNLAGSTASVDSVVWAKLEAAQKSEDLLAIAKENPGTTAATWALYRAAGDFFNQGLLDMPNNRDVALPLFKRALDLYDQVTSETAKESPIARAAALGKARTLEARNELAKAIEQYRLVAKTWPKTPEADEATAQAALLEKPEATAYYKELYAYKPTRFTLPSEPADVMKGMPSSADLPAALRDAFPSSSVDLPALGSQTIRVEPAPSPAPAPKAGTPKIETPKIETPKSEMPKTATPKAETPKSIFTPPVKAPK